MRHSNFERIYQAAISQNADLLPTGSYCIDEYAEGQYDYSAIARCAQENNRDAVEWLLNQGAHINYAAYGAGQGGLGHGPDDGIHLLAAFEDHQGGDAANAVLAGDVRVLIGVQLDHLDATFKFLGDLINNRSNHPAGTTPGGPKVHQNWNVALENVLIEGGVSDSSGARHQRLLSGAESSNGLAFCCVAALMCKTKTRARRAWWCEECAA